MPFCFCVLQPRGVVRVLCGNVEQSDSPGVVRFRHLHFGVRDTRGDHGRCLLPDRGEALRGRNRTQQNGGTYRTEESGKFAKTISQRENVLTVFIYRR